MHQWVVYIGVCLFNFLQLLSHEEHHVFWAPIYIYIYILFFKNPILLRCWKLTQFTSVVLIDCVIFTFWILWLLGECQETFKNIQFTIFVYHQRSRGEFPGSCPVHQPFEVEEKKVWCECFPLVKTIGHKRNSVSCRTFLLFDFCLFISTSVPQQMPLLIAKKY